MANRNSIFVIITLSFLASVLAQTEVQPDCPAVGVIYVPHENCTKYYVCDNGFLIVLDCPEPLYYNPNVEYCDYPENVPECVGGTRPPEGNSTTVPPPTNSTTNTPPSNSTTPTPPSNSTTPTPPSNSTTPTPPSNSTTPTPPSNSTTPTPPSNSSTPTPPSNSTTPTPPSNSTTPTPPSNSTTPTPPSNSTTPTPPSNSTTPTPPSNGTTPLPNGCPPTGVDKIPHPASCSLYIICVNGVAYDEQCAEGLQFNPILKECDFPENVNCTDPEPSTTTPNPLPECPPEGVSFHPYPGNCTLYVICVEGFPLVQMCVSGTCFDPVELQCQANHTTDFEIPQFLETESEVYFDDDYDDL